MELIWKGKIWKIKNSTLRNDYEYGGLNGVDIFSKVVSLQCSCIKRLLIIATNGNQFHFILFATIQEKNVKFHSNLEVSHSLLCKFCKFYKEIFIRWGKHLSSRATVACQFIWYNKHTQIGNKNIYLYNFLNMNLNFVGQLFDIDGRLKSWECSFNTNKLYMLYHSTGKKL